jgi:acetaldehyde dehydrogenase/alcohol dehydrogenase
VPHGRANAILLPHVIRYNAAPPSKHTAYPKYDFSIVDRKYQQLAIALELPACNAEQGVDSLARAVEGIRTCLGMPASFEEYGVDRAEYMAELDTLALNAFDDQCTGANPRYPMIAELKELLILAYEGSGPAFLAQPLFAKGRRR